MSIRIHQLSKKIGIENKELLSLLQERGFNVTSASSTIDNISADALVDEFEAKANEEAKKAEEAAKASDRSEATGANGGAPAPKEATGPRLPPGVFVKSAEQVAKEKEEALAALRPKPAAPNPTPVVPPPEPQ